MSDRCGSSSDVDASPQTRASRDTVARQPNRSYEADHASPTTRSPTQHRERGMYVIPFDYPVVPPDEARIRVQLSAVHEAEQGTSAPPPRPQGPR